MLKKLRPVGILLAILTFFRVTVSALEPDLLRIFVSIDGITQEAYRTAAKTVGEFLREINVEINENDEVNYKQYEKTVHDMEIYIDRAFDITVVLDGEETIINRPKTIVAEIIGIVMAKSGKAIIYESKDWAEKTFAGMRLELQSFKTESFEEVLSVDFETEYIYNDDVNEGVITVLADGASGERRIVMEVDYVGGLPQETRIVKDAITVEPSKRVIEIGTAEVIEVAGKAYQFEAVYDMVATAYTIDPVCTGKYPGDKGYGLTASGMKARVGVVAVDPKVIPLGTELYIEGYGHAIAGDTGGAIKGLKIDLFFDTYGECVQFGRRSVTVYVLK